MSQPSAGVTELRGDLPLPEAVELLGISEAGTDDTIGGHVVSVLGRLPEQGDQLQIEDYRVTVVEVARHRIISLRFDKAGEQEPASDE